MLHIKFVGMFMIYLRAKVCMPSSSGSLDIAIKPQTKSRFLAANLLLSYILPQKKKIP